MKRLTICLFLVMLVVGCTEKEIPLPEGIQTVSGYLTSVPFSLQRRGTHALLTASGSTLIAYAESSAVNLRLLEGQDVQLEGVLEKNLSPKDSPVFVVQKVLQGSDEQMRPWAIPALGLSVNLPKSWKGTIKGGSATFTAAKPSIPSLTITTRNVAASSPGSDQPLYGPLPVSSDAADGELLVVGLRKAQAHINAEGFWIVRIAPSASGGSETVFTFPPLPVELHLMPYRTILKTVQFSVGTTASSVRTEASFSALPPASAGSTSRASGEGAACGGVAGILCPKGLLCTITDPVSESGVCARRGQ